MRAELLSFVGNQLRSVEKLDWSWIFRFEIRLGIVTEGPWRLIGSGGVEVSDGDHGQQFGLPQPVDASIRILSLLSSREVQSVTLDEQTGDLRLHFGENTYLHFLQLSSGYESWRASTASGEIICEGGGTTVFIEG